jgi:molybdopterin/thiamine biosynthesis adenylyltransferase
VSDTGEPRRRPWHEVDAGRVAWELEQFERSGLPVAHRIGGSDGRHAGQFVVQTTLPFRGEDVPLEVVYPFDFPDAPPRVYGPGGLLDRHQSRTSGHFCLLEDPDADWWPGWSAAELVHITLRGLLEDTEAGADVVATGEADMPEPISAHVTYKAGSVVLVPDPFWSHELPDTHGEITLVDGIFSGQLVLARAAGFAAPAASLVERLTKAKSAEHRGTWVALPETPSPYPTKAELLDAAELEFPDLLQRAKRALRSQRTQKSAETWVGMTFMEEGPWRGDSRRAWLFARVVLERDKKRRIRRLVRAQALTRAERARRLPELDGLDEARVAVVGGGSLGGAVAFDLVKAGVGHIALVDYDHFDVNNVVRHVLGVEWAGTEKTIALAVEAKRRNPFAETGVHPIHVGGGQGDSDLLDTVLMDSHLVVDTTGSQAVARILDRRCREYGKRLVVAGLTSGSFGGEVLVLRPDGPCFYCFALAQQDGTIPSPTAGPRSNVTPIGCSHPAFAGAGFDATELAAIAARTVIQATYLTTYPPLEHDWAVVNFRGEPRWQSGLLQQHPGCPRCE